MFRNPVSVVCLALLMGSVSSAFAGAPDVYRITDDVLVRNPPRFSVNIDFGGGYAPWDIDRTINAWNRMVSAEPLLFQHNGIADGGGEDYLEHRNMPYLSYWDCARSGFWDGADIRVYRVVEGRLTLVRKATISRSVIGVEASGAHSEERVYFTSKGAPVQSGDLYILDMQRDAMPTQMRPNLMAKGYPMFDGIVDKTGPLQWSVDRSTFAPEGGSTASLKVVSTEPDPSRRVAMWQWYMVSNSHDAVFFPDKSYRLQIWLKQKDVANGAIRIQVGTITNLVLQAGAEWKKYEVDLPVHSPRERYQIQQGDGTRLMVGFSGSGTLWVDNFLVYQTDTPMFAFLPEYMSRVKEWHPAVIRLWGGFSAPTLDAWVLKGFRQPSRASIHGTGAPSYASLDVELQLCADVGADPWLVVNPLFREEELDGLMEYLAGPPDRGYGKLRAAQGRREPWTSAFGMIHLECGNECWNSIFSPRAWPGNPAFYARVADRLFAALKHSPLYRKDKFECIANGWDSSVAVGGWTPRVAAESREADRVDIAMYFGGWEKGVGGEGGQDDVYQDRLLATPIEYGPKLLQTLQMDPALFPRLGGALAPDTALTSDLMVGYTPRSQASAAPGVTLPPEARLAGMLCENETRRAAIIRSVGGLREAIEKPAWDIARLVLATHPSFKPKAAELLGGIDADAASKLVLAMNNLGGAPGEMTSVVKSHPGILDGLIRAVPFSSNEVATLRGVAGGGRLDYYVVNKIGKHVGDAVADLVRQGDEAFLRALEAEVTPEHVKGGVNIASCEGSGAISSACDLYAGAMLQEMKRDPAFASKACAAFAARPDLFAEAVGRIAERFPEGLESSFKKPFAATPWGAKLLMYETLPAPVVRKLCEISTKALYSPDLGATMEARRIVAAAFAMALADAAPAQALSRDAAFKTAVEGQMKSRILDVFLTAAAKDSSLGDRLLKAVQRMPPGVGAKGLAVYEAGPGYSLPGPGKPLNEEDENMGKSLASGTATLDSFMLALSLGASPISYYNFKSGAYWSSHKHPLDPIPYPTWLALQLRNRYMTGDMVTVEPVSVATRDIADKRVMATTNDGKGSEKLVVGRKGVAMTACYAFRDGPRHSILIINRDFRAAREVRLQLPFRPSGKARLYTLTHADPTAHNRLEYAVKIGEQPFEGLKDGMVVTVPPASVYLMVD